MTVALSPNALPLSVQIVGCFALDRIAFEAALFVNRALEQAGR